MNKKCFVTLMVVCMTIGASAQILFTYGDHSSDVKDFLRAYSKNNIKPVANKARSVKEYLDMYINSKLKILEAYERGYDTLPQIKDEVKNLRAQVVENYMSDPESASRLSKEAFQRSLKDIHVGHIFISEKNAVGQTDTVNAFHKSNDIIKKLQKGEDFFKVARENSEDPSAKDNGGDMGYITVFVLPYEFENIIYSTPAGKIAPLYRSRAGYHIFKNLGERKARGVIKAQQILLAIPPGSDESTKKQVAARADSIYRLIIAGENFDNLAAAYSNDYISAINGGKMPDISVGKYDLAFENALWSLSKDGAVSKPFVTSHGYHIVKRIGIKPIITDLKNKANQQALEQKISADERSRTVRDFIYNRVKNKPGLKKYPYSDAALWALSDSLLDNRPLGLRGIMELQSPLFIIGDTSYNVTNWITYAQRYRHKPDGSGVKPYEQLMEEFVNTALYDYYYEHLEDYNVDFRNQMAEFRDGNLFFEIMQREIWNRGQSDSVELLSLYEKNKNLYQWKKSADAVMFFCSDPIIANTLYEEIKKAPANWRKIADRMKDKVMPDSSRYEWEQIPNLKNLIPKPGMITSPLVNATDNTASFAYIVNVYPQPLQRSFNEARGLVINDYQAILEEKWIKELKKKYPVVIDQKVLSSISK